jgi:hypothetical protein
MIPCGNGSSVCLVYSCKPCTCCMLFSISSAVLVLVATVHTSCATLSFSHITLLAVLSQRCTHTHQQMFMYMFVKPTLNPLFTNKISNSRSPFFCDLYTALHSLHPYWADQVTCSVMY